jgi:heme exporter protein C
VARLNNQINIKMRKTWWKILGAVLVIYTTIAGLLLGVPHLNILNETIRNLYFHVPMWFAMIVLFSISVVYSIISLSSKKEIDDIRAVEAVNAGIIFGILGLVTGAVWAKFTWGQFWSFDPKQNFAAISILLYFAYLVLRNAIDEEQKRAKIAAIYNIFAFPMMVVLLFVLPRLQSSLHPGNGGNPGFNSYDLDSRMRMVFYPACLGWILIGYWIYTIRFRTRVLENKSNL